MCMLALENRCKDTGYTNIMQIRDQRRGNWLTTFSSEIAIGQVCVCLCVCFCRYTLDNLKFGKMDITRYPDVAKKYVFALYSSVWINDIFNAYATTQTVHDSTSLNRPVRAPGP